MIDRKQKIIHRLRRLHLLTLIDSLRYFWDFIKNLPDNHEFSIKFPDFRYPPSYLAYDAYGHTNRRLYYESGLQQAQFLARLIKQHLDDELIRICEWGCGPARILRHLPQFFSGSPIDFYGYDYNPRTIKWCREYIDHITFNTNLLAPPLRQESNWFDCVYCVSVFTHLSSQMHFVWISELLRVVKPGGLIILTTHGDATTSHLLGLESQMFDRGELVVRGCVKEGTRTYVAYHPPSFIRNTLLKGLEIISYLPNPESIKLGQDVWVVRNTK